MFGKKSVVVWSWWSVGRAGGKGYFAREAAEQVERVHEVARIKALAVNGSMLLESYILADRPVVVEGAASASVVARLREAGYWAPGETPEWFMEILSDNFVGSPVLRYGGETTRRSRTQSWGCARPAKQCAVAWWYSGARIPDYYRSRGGPQTSAGSGAHVHTDAVCAPSWSLQVEGEKTWTLGKRTHAERYVPLGDEYLSSEAYTTTLAPGDLLVFFNGWQPHATNALHEDGFTASVHGVVDFDDIGRRLWSREALALKTGRSPGKKGTRYAPSPRMLSFCPDLREIGGFEPVVEDAEDDDDTVADGTKLDTACSASDEPEFRPLASFWKPAVGRPGVAEPWAGLARFFGHLLVPSAADVDGDGDIDVVIGQADGGLWLCENVGTPSEPAFGAPRDLRPALKLAAPGVDLSHAAPSLADLDGDGRFDDLIVGLYDGTLAFLVLDPTDAYFARIQEVPLHLDLIRAAPLVLDDGILVASESSDLRFLDFSSGTVLPVDNRLPRARVVKLAALDPFSAASPENKKRRLFVGDGGVQALRLARFDRPTLALLPDSMPFEPFDALSIDALSEAFHLDVGAYPAPALADFNADGRADLLLGDLFGSLLFFDGHSPIPPAYTDDAPPDFDE